MRESEWHVFICSGALIQHLQFTLTASNQAFGLPQVKFPLISYFSHGNQSASQQDLKIPHELAERIISLPGLEHTANQQTSHSRTILVEAHFLSKLCYLFTHTFHWLRFQKELVHFSIRGRPQKQVWSCWQWDPSSAAAPPQGSFIPPSHVLHHLQSVSDTGQSVQHSLTGWDCTWGPRTKRADPNIGQHKPFTSPSVVASRPYLLWAPCTRIAHITHANTFPASRQDFHTHFTNQKTVKVVCPVRGFFSSLHPAQGAAEGDEGNPCAGLSWTALLPRPDLFPPCQGHDGLNNDISW